ncbi:MAG: argininosuccinate lyase [Oscillospiraceae bacterium]|nr:argininosuccinate lyase [Oscillospiraceae bacterium]
MAKMWAGRFSKEVDSKVNDFNSSISFDARMYRQDIKGSIAHATMLGNCGIIDKADAKTIAQELDKILCDIDSGMLSFDPTAEDIHMFVEAELTKRLGETGKRLHTARSRNDQVALDIRMYLRDESENVIGLIKELVKTITEIASEHTQTIMPGYTHLQRAQPITFAHHIMAYAWMLLRDIGRIKDAVKRMNYLPLGSGALAGTTYPIDRQMVANALSFDGVVENSLDGVSDRDFCIELLSAFATLMMHLSRFSEEIIMWCSWEFKFIELDDAYATGSSIMPQKKNPDIAELVRGKTGRVIGNLTATITMLKGLALAYNKDMQEDKEAIFDAIDTVKLCVSTFIPMLQTMTVLKDNMRNAAARGFINATDCADYLVKKGMAFRDAYKITGGLVALCIQKNTVLENLPLEDYKSASDVFEQDVYQAISLDTCVNERKSQGGPAPQRVKEQIENCKKELEKA